MVVVLGVSLVALTADDEPAPDGEAASLPAGEGEWTARPEAPLAPRLAQVMVATDDELIVWGGYGEEDYDDGAAYSFESDTWRELAPSPLPPRLFTVVEFGLGTVSSGPPA